MKRDELEASFEIYQEKRKERQSWEYSVVEKNTNKYLFWIIKKTKWAFWANVTGVLIEGFPDTDHFISRITRRGELLDEKIFILDEDEINELIRRKVLEKENKRRRM